MRYQYLDKAANITISIKNPTLIHRDDVNRKRVFERKKSMTVFLYMRNILSADYVFSFQRTISYP